MATNAGVNPFRGSPKYELWRAMSVPQLVMERENEKHQLYEYFM